jgi:transposase
VLHAGGEVVEKGRVATTGKGLSGLGGGRGRCLVALETGTHSPWVSRLVERLGHDVVVAYARQVRLIAENSRKDDRMDARTLARLARVDPELLNPVRHRSAEAHRDLTLVRGRAAPINSARGLSDGCWSLRVGEARGRDSVKKYHWQSVHDAGTTVRKKPAFL